MRDSLGQCRLLRGSEIETNTCISGMTIPIFMGDRKSQETTQNTAL